MSDTAPRFFLFRHAIVIATAFVANAAGIAATPLHVPESYTLREWHEQDGLPSDEIVGVLQDGNGFLWVSTQNALVRFDGATFDSIEVPSGGYARGLAFIPAGQAGAAAIPALPGIHGSGTEEAGCYVLRNGAFRFEPESGLAGKAPQTLFAAPDGSLWLGCSDGTVQRRHGRQSRLFEPPADLVGRRKPVFATDADGNVWIQRGNRLGRVDGEEWIDIAFSPAESELRIASSPTGGIWVITRTSLLRWNGSSLEEVVPLPELLGAHFVEAALEDTHGFLWVGTRSQGLFRIVGRDILPVPTSSNDVSALCEDSDDNLWVSTLGGGLNRLRAKAHHLFDQASGLRDNFSYTVAEDTSGAIWLANRDGGMARVIGMTADPISHRVGWRSFSARSVYPAPDGSVWITTGIGVFRTQAATPETVERIAPLTHLRGARATFVAGNGDYWLAADPDRVVRWRHGEITTFGPDDGYDGRDIRAFAEDATGRIWVGAAEGRLFRLAGDRFERVDFPLAEDCGPLQVIRCESDGTLLIGTTRRGVVVVPEGDFSRTHFLDREHGLADNNISQILVDDHDRTWFASRRSIFWVHGGQLRDFVAGKSADVHAVMLGKDDGVPYLSCLGLYQPAAWKARDGTLWFATRRGMLRTDPALLSSGSDGPPPVTITRITSDGKIQPAATELAIDSTVRKLEIRLSAVNLSAPESVQIRTRLDGFDSDWVVHARERVVSYPRLPPGRYVFNTMASDGGGSWSSQPALLTITVTPPWWQSGGMRALYVLVAIAVIGVTVRRWSHRRLRRRLEQSEREHAVERERSRIARNIHDDVGASLTRISLLTQAAQQESGVPSPTLEKIHEAARTITRSMEEIVWAVNPRHDNSESLVYYLVNYARGFLETAGIGCRLESPGTLPDAALTSQVRHHLFLCCKEALNNVVKHAGATVVTIHVSIGDGTLAIAISDNGRGIARTPQTAGETQPSSSGNGLRNMRQRLAEIHGTCSIAGGPQGGTTVTFTVPLPPSQPGSPSWHPETADHGLSSR